MFHVCLHLAHLGSIRHEFSTIGDDLRGAIIQSIHTENFASKELIFFIYLYLHSTSKKNPPCVLSKNGFMKINKILACFQLKCKKAWAKPDLVVLALLCMYASF